MSILRFQCSNHLLINILFWQKTNRLQSSISVYYTTCTIYSRLFALQVLHFLIQFYLYISFFRPSSWKRKTEN